MKTTLQVLAAIAAGATALGGLDLAGIVHLLPEPWAAILAVAPPAVATVAHAIAAAIKGAHEASTFTKCLPFLLALSAAGMLAGCGTLAPVIGADGCILQPVETDAGDAYRIGYCPDGRIVAEWTSRNGVSFRAAWREGDGSAAFYYRPDPAGEWIPWGAKAGPAPAAPPVVPQ